MRLALSTVALTCLVAVSAVFAAAPAPNVKGSLVRSSASSCLPGDVCDPVPPPAYVVFTRAGHSTRAKLAPNGAFALHLDAGAYSALMVVVLMTTLATPIGLRWRLGGRAAE